MFVKLIFIQDDVMCSVPEVHAHMCRFSLSVCTKCGRIPDSFIVVVIQYQLDYMIDHISCVWYCIAS